MGPLSTLKAGQVGCLTRAGAFPNGSLQFWPSRNHWHRWVGYRRISYRNKSLLQKFIDQIASIFSIKRKKNVEEKKNKKDDDDDNNLSEDIYPLW